MRTRRSRDKKKPGRVHDGNACGPVHFVLGGGRLLGMWPCPAQDLALCSIYILSSSQYLPTLWLPGAIQIPVDMHTFLPSEALSVLHYAEYDAPTGER